MRPRTNDAVGSTDRWDAVGLIDRREVLGSIAAIGLVGLAGCTGEETVEPVSLDGELSCDVCGMIIEDHPGPVGQIHFEDDTEEGGRPAQFCSAICTYEYRFDAEDAGRTAIETFLTDYSTVDYDVYEEAGIVHITSHVGADAFGPESSLTLVIGSDSIGAMGPAIVPFGEPDDAAEFADEHGGELFDPADVDRELIEAL